MLRLLVTHWRGRHGALAAALLPSALAAAMWGVFRWLVRINPREPGVPRNRDIGIAGQALAVLREIDRALDTPEPDVEP